MSHTPRQYERKHLLARDDFQRLLSLRSALGITRIGDITGLDRTGIPVVQAVRPQSLSNAVCQGKGRTLEEAAISAIFEAAETFCAEKRNAFEAFTARADELRDNTGWLESYILPSIARNWRSTEIDWLNATDVLSRKTVPIPLELIHTAFVHPSHERDGVFIGTSTGLAAAFCDEDAMVHGLLECVERDAIGRAKKSHGFLHLNKVDLSTIVDEALTELIEDLHKRKYLVGLWLIPTYFGVSVVWCQIIEDDEFHPHCLPYPSDGWAAGFDPAGTAISAIHEAAQVRLAVISGGRDDIRRTSYPSCPDWSWIKRHRQFIAEFRGPLSLLDVGSDCRSSPKSQLDGLISTLAQKGHEAIVSVDMSNLVPGGLSVVKMIVPSMNILAE